MRLPWSDLLPQRAEREVEAAAPGARRRSAQLPPSCPAHFLLPWRAARCRLCLYQSRSLPRPRLPLA